VSQLQQSDIQLYKRLLGYAWPFKRFFFISFFGFLLYAMADMLLADMMQYMIDSLGENINVEKRNGIIVTFLHEVMVFDVTNTQKAQILIPCMILAFSFMRAIGAFLGNFFIKYVGNNVVYGLRQDVFQKLVELPVSDIENQSGGSLVSRVIFNVSQVTGAVTSAITTIFRDGLTIIVLLTYLIYINWKLTLTFLLVAPIIAAIVGYVSKRFRRLSRRLQNSMGDVTHVVSETINGTRDLRIYGAQGSEVARFEQVSKNTLKQQIKMALTEAAFSPTIQMFMAVSIAILVYLGLQPAVIQSMSAGLFITFLGAAGALAKPLRQLTNVLNVVQKALAAAQDIFHQLDLVAEETTGQKQSFKQAVKGDVSFNQVGFRYSEDSPDVLSDINLTVEAGQLIGLVGGSGGGKSTLMSLLPRFYNQSEGRITIDGVDTQTLSLSELRQQIALVSQHVVLMNDTVFNNIAYGEMRSYPREKVIEAAKLANAHEFIEKMEQGYDTEIGDNGVRLSGGQRQRLAIARAILKQAPILILDEATSALDNDSERLIQQAMKTVAKGRTTFVIAHRLSTIEKADCIYVMDHGRIVESGTHQSLVAQQGKYFALQQMSGSSVDNSEADAPNAPSGE